MLVASAAALFSTQVAGCGDDEVVGPVEITLAGESELFPSLEYSTGLQPAGALVQASFTVSAKGVSALGAKALASGSEASPTLSGVPNSGTFALAGGFALIGQLVVDIDGLPSYDGPIPGIENVEIPIVGEAQFSPFSIGTPVSVRADVPPADLPGIPLPGGIPGQLVIAVADGSFVELELTGSCAGIGAGEARYTGTIKRGGVLVLAPRVEVDVPFIGTQTFDIPSISVDLALGENGIAATGAVTSFGEKPAQGDHVTGSCNGGGEGGANAGGGAAGGEAGGAADPNGGSPGTGGAPASTCLVGPDCTNPDPMTCSCMGCDPNGCWDPMATPPIVSDCTCPVCDDRVASCGCVDDGICDPFTERCDCIDCMSFCD